MSRHVDVAKPVLGDSEYENLEEVLDSGRFLQGKYVEEFEKKWAEYVGVDHAIAVSNGTTALQLSLAAIGLEPGDEVIVPSLSFASTATAVLHQGGIPVFADIDRETYNLAPDDVQRCISDRTAAVIPVHLYGQPAAMNRINEIATEHGIAVIEDAAQAHGARYNGDVAGSLGDVGCFSFYATKNITTGEGGIITTDDDSIEAELRKLRNHGLESRDVHGSLGYNYRMTELQAAIGTAQIDRLDEFNARRAEISRRYFDELADVEWLRNPTIRDDVDHAFFWAPFEVDEDAIGRTGKQVWEDLQSRGVETRHRYTAPLYDQPVFQEHLGFNSDFPWNMNDNTHEYDLDLPNVEAVVGAMIGLPNHPELESEDFEYVVDTLREYGRDHDAT